MLLDNLIYYALLNNERIVETVAKTTEGIPLVNRNKNPQALYPAIEYHMIGGGDINFADEEVFFTRHTYQVTFYGDEDDYIVVEDEMVSTLRRIGFRVTHKYSHTNPYTYITHYVYHVQANMESTYYETLLAEEWSKYQEKYMGEEYKVPGGTYYDELADEDYYIDEDYVLDDLELLDEYDFY